MNTTDFDIDNAINLNSQLNPQLFLDEHMRPEVRKKLIEIADAFREFIGIQLVTLVDIEVSGSNAAYSYTPFSDIDLHLLVDFTQLPNNDVYRELFDAKKYQFNDQHDIKIKGYDVELYVQDAAQPHTSLGAYSVLNNEWNRYPERHRANFDDTASKMKYLKLKNLAVHALASDNPDYLNNVLDVVKRYRRAGLAENGEFGPENLAFKVLRHEGIVQKLWAKKRKHTDKQLSLETADDPVTLANNFNAELSGEMLPEALIRQVYNARPSLFDEFEFDYVYECATRLSEASYEGNIGAMEMMQFYRVAPKEMIMLLDKLIAAKKTKEAWQLVQKVTNTQLVGKQFNEEGRVVLNINTTADVKPGEIKKQAKKLGFTVSADGVPPLLHEVNMAPGRLQQNVIDLLADHEVLIGLEFEICIPSLPDNDEDTSLTDEDKDITPQTSLTDVTEFFRDNTDEDWKQDTEVYIDWVASKADDLIETQVKSAADNPDKYHDQLVAALIKFESTIPTISELGVDKIVNEASAAIEEFGVPVDWPEPARRTNPYLAVYYDVFVDNFDEAAEPLRDSFNEWFWGTTYENDEDTYTFGAYLLEKGFGTYYDVFMDNNETLVWPGEGLEGAFNIVTAERIAAALHKKLGAGVDISPIYHGADRGSDWIVELDVSVTPEEGDHGFELIMPPTPYIEGLSQIADVSEMLLTEFNAYTNTTTGLHINVSVGGINLNDVDYTKLALLVGDEYVLSQFDRLNNSYTVPAVTKLFKFINPGSSSMFNYESKLKGVSNLVQRLKGDVSGAMREVFGRPIFDKNTSIVFKDDYIEFRSPGNTGYLENIDKVINTINRFVTLYGIAADPDSHNKEYGKKLYRLIAKTMGNKTIPQWQNRIMQLFAAFSSNIIDKDDLVKGMSRITSERAESAARDEIDRLLPEYARDIGTTYPTLDVTGIEKWLLTGFRRESSLIPNDPLTALTLAYNNMLSNVTHYVTFSRSNVVEFLSDMYKQDTSWYNDLDIGLETELIKYGDEKKAYDATINKLVANPNAYTTR